MEHALLDQLKPIFPNLTEEVILLSIRHPSNNTGPADSMQSVFLSCIDDLLQLRTFSLASAESQKKYLSSDDDESLVKAVEKLKKKEELSLNNSKKNNVKETNSISKKIPNSQETNSIVKKIPNTQETNNIAKQTTNSQEAGSSLKPSEAATKAACSGDPKSLSLYQTVRKDVIDSEESSNDSLPDPGLNLDKSKDLLSGKSNVNNPHNQMWSSPLHLCKQKWKVNTGSHSAEVLSKVIEGQRTRYHSEPSEPVFSLNKALNKTGTLIKPAVFSPIKSTDGAVASGLKKTTVIKPATFSANKNNNSMSPDSKTASIIRPPKFSPRRDALLFDEKGLLSTKTKPGVSNNIIKPGRFRLKPNSSGVVSGATDKSSRDSLSSSPGKVFSLGDSNANYKLTVVDSPRDEGISDPNTSRLGNPPAGMEKWKYVCVEADDGLLDDEQTYRKEILSKSGEVIGKLQDERRKSLVGLNLQKGDIKEVEKASTSGTSTKSASKALLKTNTLDSCSKPQKSQTSGHSSKADTNELENTSGLRNISKPTVKGLEEKSVYRPRSRTGVNEVKKRTKVHVDTDEEENIGIKISASADKEDDELPTFSFLKKARRQRGDLSVPLDVSLVNNKKRLIDLTRTRPEIPDVRRRGPRNEVFDKDVTVIDITNSSQSSVGSQDNSVINVEALPEFVDITNEQLDVPEDVFEVKAMDRNKETPEVIVVQQSHEPVLAGNPVDQFRKDTAVTHVVSVRSGVTVTVSQTGGAGAPSTTQTSRPQPAPTPVVTKQPTPATNLPTSAANLPPLPTLNKSPEEKLTDMVNEVLLLFPDVDPLYVRNLLLTNIGPESMNNVCNLLLENSSYPRAQKGPSSTVSSDPPPTKRSNKNFYEEFSDPVTAVEYRTNCELLLQSEFKMISVKDIRILASYYNWHYAPMHKALSQIIKKGLENIQAQDKGKQSLSQAVIVCDITVGSEKKSVKATCLKCPRFTKCSLSCLPPDLSEEYEFVQERLKEDATDEDMRIAQQINESEYAETGQLIECGCCYCEVAFDNMVQCYEGHLFCSECLMNYANESVFGHGKASLLCMSDGCDASFPKSQLDKALPANILNKYNDRVQEESINLAALEDLVRCPHCDFAALLDPSVKVFSCQNTSCMKETCRHCKEEWKEHFGKRCDEIEKKDEVSLRIKFEEKMAMAKIRTCHRCKAKFMKEEGCNKMTCKCGATMCYVCRKPNIDYKHFCQHLREPKKPCKECDACFLWSKAEEDDERAIAEIRKECEAVRMEKGYSLEKIIGAPEEPPSKKLKVK